MIPAIQLYAGLQGVYLALLDDRLNDPLDDPLNDSVAVAHNWPQQQAWALSWIDAIGQMYHLNRLRLAVLGQPQAFAPRDCDLRRALEQMAKTHIRQLPKNSFGLLMS